MFYEYILCSNLLLATQNSELLFQYHHVIIMPANIRGIHQPDCFTFYWYLCCTVYFVLCAIKDYIT